MTGVLKLYKEFLARATKEQIDFVDSVYQLCEKHYSDGGSTIVECFEPEEILKEFKTLSDIRRFCGLKVEQALNCRWGEDSDEEVETMKRFDENWRK